MNGLDKFVGSRGSRLALAGAALVALSALSGCNDASDTRSMQALSSETTALMAQKGVSPQSPMLIRAYKKESEFEIWKMRPDGQYVLLKTFPICRWSGQLGPKLHEGDRQSPEGFYSITPAMMNPHSAYYLSFNIGYPNAYDRAHGATGGSVMVHGVCSSAGCFSMTDAQVAEIYAIARESFAGGQRAIQMQSYPFHFEPKLLAKYRLDPNMPFWRELKKGDDHFEATKRDVPVAVCGGHYVFGAKSADGSALEAEAPCPALKTDADVEAKVAQIERAENAAVAALVAKTRPVRLVYQDGAQHPAFANKVADVSRPETLTPPVEVALDDPRAAKARGARGLAVAQIAKAETRRQEEAERKAQASAKPSVTATQMQAQAEAARPGPLAVAQGQGDKLASLIGAFSGGAAPAPAAETIAPKSADVTAAIPARASTPVKPDRAVVAKTVAAKPAAAKPVATRPAAEKPQAALPSDGQLAAIPGSPTAVSATLR